MPVAFSKSGSRSLNATYSWFSTVFTTTVCPAYGCEAADGLAGAEDAADAAAVAAVVGALDGAVDAVLPPQAPTTRVIATAAIPNRCRAVGWIMRASSIRAPAARMVAGFVGTPSPRSQRRRRHS